MTRNIIIGLSVFIFAFSTLNIYGQSGSFLVNLTSPNDETVGEICEVGNNVFLPICSNVEWGAYSILFKINKEGGVLDSLVLNDSCTYSVIGSLDKNQHDQLVLGMSFFQCSDDSMRIYQFIIDTSLVILEKRLLLSSIQPHIQSFNAIHREFDSFYGVTTIQNGVSSNAYLIRVNDLGVIKTKRYEKHNVYQCIYDFDINSDSIIILIGKNLNINALSDRIYFFSDSLQLIKEDSSIIVSRLIHNIRYLESDTAIFSGKVVVNNANFEDADVKVDFYTDTIISSFFLGCEDTIDHPSILSGIDFFNTDRLFFCYTKGFNPRNIFSVNPSWISILKTDREGIPLYERFYGGDAYYIVWSIKASGDSGVFLAGTRSELGCLIKQRDVFLYKLNADGLLTSTPENPTLRPHHAIVYPNPGHGVLKVEAGPQIFGATFELFDMGGQRVVQQTLQTSVTTLNTAPLTSGVYPWRIVWKGEVVEEGKWVKDL